MQDHYPLLFDRLEGDDDRARALWTESIRDLVYRMVELQEMEQREASEDPFAVLQNNAELLDVSIFSARSRNKYAAELLNKNKKPESSASSSQVGSKRPMDSSTSPRKDPAATNSGAVSSDSSLWNSLGLKCSNCSSRNTTITGSNFSQTKCETWGSKSYEESETIQCFDCGHKKTM